MRNKNYRTWNNGEKHSKTCKMRNAHCRTWIVARKLKNVEDEIQTLYDPKYSEEH
jgi:hypothetical protein